MKNPYLHLHQQMRRLIRSERLMGPDLRQPFSWMLRADFEGTFIQIIKGGANTIVIMTGEHRLPPYYPEHAMERIQELYEQDYHVYDVRRRNGATRRFFFLQDAKKVRPRKGDTIIGYANGATGVAYHAFDTLHGYKWTRRGGGDP